MFERANHFFRRKSRTTIIDVSKMSTYTDKYPYTPREPSTTSLRSSSTSSNFSTTSSTRKPSLTHDELHERAVSILTTLTYPSGDMSSLPSYVSDGVIIQHDDSAPTTSLSDFLDRWQAARSRFPDFKFEIQEACVDEIQRKVWVRSEISGTGLKEGLVKESVDMMTFDEDGVLVRSVDCQRVKRIGDMDEED